MMDFIIDTSGVVLAYLTAGIIGGPVGEVVVALITGAMVGAVFAVVGSTVPAPPNLAGLMGVIGITAGYAITTSIRG
jgi:XapX domain-containing protein